jgi:general secretion pathway protein G
MMKTQAGRGTGRGGFTLVEMLVVLTIIMLLAGIVTVNVIRHQAEAKVKTAHIQIAQLLDAVRLYQTEQGRPPTMEQGLESLVRKPVSPPVPEKYPEEGYLSSRRLPKDPWGHDYIYLAPGREGAPFEIVSYGSDGAPGGAKDAADLSSLEP